MPFCKSNSFELHFPQWVIEHKVTKHLNLILFLYELIKFLPSLKSILMYNTMVKNFGIS